MSLLFNVACWICELPEITADKDKPLSCVIKWQLQPTVQYSFV